MADVQYVTLYLPDGTPVQVVEGGPLHALYVARGANGAPPTPGPVVRLDPFPQYVDQDELTQALGGVGASDTAVAALVNDTGSQTRGALGAAFGRRLAVPPLDVALPSVMASPPTFAVSGPGGASPINAGAPLLIPYNDARITHLGQVNTTVNQFGTDYLQNAVNAADTPAPGMDEFDFYGDDLALRFRCGATGSSSVWVWVNGHPATAAPVTLATNTSGGSLSFYRITFGSVGLYRIRIYRNGVTDFGGLDIKPTHSIAPVPRTRPKLFVLGDSWVAGTGATNSLTGFAQTVGLLLGMETFQVGQGGTGYVNNGGGGNKGPFTDDTRLAKVTAAAPDYVLVFGSQNDDGLSGIQTAAASVYAQLATNLPSAKVVVAGPPSLASPASADRLANRDAVKAAALAAPNVLGFIDSLSDAQGLGWVSGFGNNGAPTGTGNADVFANSGTNAAHPTQAGHDYYARRIAQEAAGLLLAA